jgi:hypothetical protein
MPVFTSGILRDFSSIPISFFSSPPSAVVTSATNRVAVLLFQVPGGIEGSDFALVHEGDTMAQLICLPHIMGGQKDGGPTVALLQDDVADSFGGYGVKTRRWLIHKDNLHPFLIFG